MSLNDMLQGVPCQCGGCTRRDEAENTGCWTPFRFWVRVDLDGGATLDVNPRTSNVHAAMLVAKASLAEPSNYPAVRAHVLDMNISDPDHRIVWSS